jgi:hypothetical protein
MHDRASLEHFIDVIEAGGELSQEQLRVAAAAARQALMLPEAVLVGRDKRIVECRRKFFGDLTARAAANEVATGLNRYFTLAWRRDRSVQSCPDRIANHVNGAYWHILKIVPRTVCREKIRKIVGF